MTEREEREMKVEEDEARYEGVLAAVGYDRARDAIVYTQYLT